MSGPTNAIQGATERAVRYFWGDDAFISYARRDADSYATALGNRLLQEGYACVLDQWTGEPGKQLPKRLLATLARSAVMVVIGSSRAATSEAMKEEIERFRRTARPIVAIDLDGTIESAIWWPLIAGLHVSVETPEARRNAEPSPLIIKKIADTIGVNRKVRRQAKVTAAGAAIVFLLMVAAGIAGVMATTRGIEAREQAGRAKDAGLEAERQTQNANAAKAEASTAQEAAKEAGKEVIRQRQAAATAREQAETQTHLAAVAQTRAGEALAEQRNAEAQTRESVAQALIATGHSQLEMRPERAVSLAYEAARLSPTMDAVSLLRAGVQRVPLWFELTPPWSKPDRPVMYFELSEKGDDVIAANDSMSRVVSLVSRDDRTGVRTLGVYEVPGRTPVSTISLAADDQLMTPARLTGSLLSIKTKTTTAATGAAIYDIERSNVHQPALTLDNVREIAFTNGTWPAYVVSLTGEVVSYEPSRTGGFTHTSLGTWTGLTRLAVYPSAETRAVAVLERGRVSLLRQNDGVWQARKIEAPILSSLSVRAADYGPDPARLVIALTSNYGADGEFVYALDDAGRVQQVFHEKGRSHLVKCQVVKRGTRVIVSWTSIDSSPSGIAVIDIDWTAQTGDNAIQFERRGEDWFRHGSQEANTYSTVSDIVASSNGSFLVVNKQLEGTTGLTSSSSALEFWDIRPLEFKGDISPRVIDLHTNGSPIKRLAFAADGLRLLAWDANGVVSIFRVNASADRGEESGRVPREVLNRLQPRIEAVGDSGRFRKIGYGTDDVRYINMLTGQEVKVATFVSGTIKSSFLTDDGSVLTAATSSELVRIEHATVTNRRPFPDPAERVAIASDLTVAQSARKLTVYDTVSLKPVYEIDVTGLAAPMWTWAQRDKRGSMWVYLTTGGEKATVHCWQIGERAPGAGRTVLTSSHVNVGLGEEGAAFDYWVVDGILIVQTVPTEGFLRSPFGVRVNIKTPTAVTLYDLRTGEPRTLTPPAGKGWPPGFGSLENIYLTEDDQLFLLLRYREDLDKEELAAASWSRDGGACRSFVPMHATGQILLNAYVGGRDIVHLLVRTKSDFVLMRMSDGVELWRDRHEESNEDIFPPLLYDSRTGTWSGVRTASFQKTVQRIFLAGEETADAFTHMPLPASLTAPYQRWLTTR